MKKFLGYISLFMALLITAVAVTSCIINDSEPEALPVPMVSSKDKTYRMSFASITNMKYANVFRERSSTVDFDTVDDVKNIGQVVPTDVNNPPSTFQFYDEYTINGSYYYRYRIRYYDGSIYRWSKYTTPYIGIGIGEATIESAGDLLDLYWDESKGAFILNLASKVIGLEDFTEVDFVISNGTVKRPFKFGDLVADSDPSIDVSADPQIQEYDLQKNLSAEFLDCATKIESIICVRVEEDDDHYYKSHYWSKPILINATDKKLTMYDKPVIDAATRTADKYIDKDGNAMSSVAETDGTYILTIPSQKSPENGFDYNPNIANLFID